MPEAVEFGSTGLGEQGLGEQERIVNWLSTRMPTLQATWRCLHEEAELVQFCNSAKNTMQLDINMTEWVRLKRNDYDKKKKQT